MTHKGDSSADFIAIVTRHYAIIEGGGQIRVSFDYENYQGSRGKPYFEIIGSSNGWLVGSNTYLDNGEPTGSYNKVLTVPSNATYVSIMLQLNMAGQTSEQTSEVTWKNLKVTRV